MDIQALLDGLQAVSDSAFPKRCSNCGKVYETVEQFKLETDDLGNGSGLMANIGDTDDEILVELYRNCSCGSTLMDFCYDRRDKSENGKQRRDHFNHVLVKLTSCGIDNDVARLELLKVIHGEKSPLIEKLLKKIKSQ